MTNGIKKIYHSHRCYVHTFFNPDVGLVCLSCHITQTTSFHASGWSGLFRIDNWIRLGSLIWNYVHLRVSLTFFLDQITNTRI